MGNLFAFEGMVKPYVVAIDSALLKSKGHVVCHASSMKNGVVPRSRIDTDARWRFSHAKGWIFGYKLHMVCSTYPVIVPLIANVTTANVSDKHVYKDLLIPSTSSSSRLSPITLKRIHLVVTDPGYDDQSLYDLSMARGF